MKNIFVLVAIAFLAGCNQSKQAVTPAVKGARVVTLSPAATQIVCALGGVDNLVGVPFIDKMAGQADDEWERLVASKHIQSIGGFDGKLISVEQILAMEPDFVYGSKGMHDFLLPVLKERGIVLYLSQSQNVASIFSEIKYIAHILQKEEAAEKLCLAISSHIDALTKEATLRAGLQKKCVFFVVWSEPLMTAGKASYINELIDLAGGANLFSDLGEEYPIVGAEAVILGKPDVILTSASDKSVAPQKIAAMLGGVPIRQYSDNVTLPGVAVDKAVEELFSLIYPLQE